MCIRDSVRIHLITGRHHQIRVQFASRGHALVGDYKYSAYEHNAACDMDAAGYGNDSGRYDMDAAVKASSLKRNQIALCAVSLTIDDKTYSVTPDFAQN